MVKNLNALNFSKSAMTRQRIKQESHNSLPLPVKNPPVIRHSGQRSLPGLHRGLPPA